MNKMIAVFRSKSDTIAFYQRLQKGGIKVRNRSIPSYLKMPCGICVEFDTSDFHLIKKLLSYSGYKSFVGFYPAN